MDSFWITLHKLSKNFVDSSLQILSTNYPKKNSFLDTIDNNINFCKIYYIESLKNYLHTYHNNRSFTELPGPKFSKLFS